MARNGSEFGSTGVPLTAMKAMALVAVFYFGEEAQFHS